MVCGVWPLFMAEREDELFTVENSRNEDDIDRARSHNTLSE